jgi:hypothetical protein
MSALSERERWKLTGLKAKQQLLRTQLAMLPPGDPAYPERARERTRLGSMLAEVNRQIIDILQMELFRDGS